MENQFDMDGSREKTVMCVGESIAITFPDSILVNQDFEIVQIGENIVHALGYTRGEVLGKSVSFLINAEHFLHAINTMAGGHIEGEQMEIKRKNKGISTCKVSGFRVPKDESSYLIVLNFRDISKADQALSTHLTMTEELDKFIYHSAHILRGPLATIQGLTHLAKSTDPGDLSFLINEIEKHASKLDSILYRLVYFAESDKEYLEKSIALSLEIIIQKIENNLREVQLDYPVIFHCQSEEKTRIFENGQILYSILNHFVLFLGNKPKEKNNMLVIDTQTSSSATEIMIRSKGFKLTRSLIETIEHINYGHSEILRFPDLVNYYAAKKIILKSGGKVQFMRIDESEIVIMILLPAAI